MQLAEGRCVTCGQVLIEAAVTSEDTTLYAQRLEAGRRGWWSMAWWVFTAGSARISFLARMRASRASRRFVRIGALYVALCAAVLAAAHMGWKLVADVPITPMMGEHVKPTGDGWYLITQGPAPSDERAEHPEPTDLWWNPSSSLIAGVSAFVTALLLVWVLVALLRGLVERALQPRHRGQERLAAAIHYDFAWAVWLLPATFVLLLLPLGYVGRVQRNAPYPPIEALFVVAAVVLAVGLLMGWFTLIRAGATVPAGSRGRALALLGVWAPLIAAALLVGTGLGLWQLLNLVVAALNLQW
jgi:hypothetical protein